MKHKIGELVTYHNSFRTIPAKHGIIVYWECHVYERYKVAWFDGGFNFFSVEEIDKLKKNFKRLAHAKA